MNVVAVNFVNYSMYVINAPRPHTGKIMLKRLGFADTFKWSKLD